MNSLEIGPIRQELSVLLLSKTKLQNAAACGIPKAQNLVMLKVGTSAYSEFCVLH